jgi:hypothetical protein
MDDKEIVISSFTEKYICKVNAHQFWILNNTLKHRAFVFKVNLNIQPKVQDQISLTLTILLRLIDQGHLSIYFFF